jgi:hypothetical protein
MHPTRLFRVGSAPLSSGFTLMGAVASLSVLAAIAAIGVPIVTRQLRARAQGASESVHRAESVVETGWGDVAAMADACAREWADSTPSFPPEESSPPWAVSPVPPAAWGRRNPEYFHPWLPAPEWHPRFARPWLQRHREGWRPWPEVRLRRP